MAYQFDAKPEYIDGALNQIHYMFGRNALNKSFMTGIGENPPEYPHIESMKALVPMCLDLW